MFAAGIVDGLPAMLEYAREISLEAPALFVALRIDRDRMIAIHEFLFARYAIKGITVYRLDVGEQE